MTEPEARNFAGRAPASNIADVRRGGMDRHDNEIFEVYSKKDHEYVVYLTEDRVNIMFADDPAMNKEQRRKLAPLLPLRDEIDGLLQGWRGVSDKKPKTLGFFGLRDPDRCRTKLESQNRRVGGALVQAVEDDATGARLLLEQIKNDLVNERVAFARFEYLLTAFTTALIVLFGAWLLASLLPVTNAAPLPIPPRLVNGIAFFSLAALVVAIVGAGLAASGRFKKPALPAVLLALLAIPVIAVLIALVSPALAAEEIPVTRTTAIGTIVLLLAATLWLAFVTAHKPNSVRRAALVFAIVAIPLFAVLIWPQTPTEVFDKNYTIAVNMWRGFAAGAVGAFFSIALAIKGRTVLPDLVQTANMLDALLRVAVGAIGGAVLIALIASKMVQFPLVETGGNLFALTAGFFAGFSERLVPDLLDKASEKSVKFDAEMAMSRSQREAQAEKLAAKLSDLGLGETVKTDTKPAEAAVNDNVPDNDVEVGKEGFRLDDDEMTRDEELPAAMGGAAKA